MVETLHCHVSESLVRVQRRALPCIPLSAYEILFVFMRCFQPLHPPLPTLNSCSRHASLLGHRAAGCVESAQPSFLPSQQMRSERLCVVSRCAGLGKMVHSPVWLSSCLALDLLAIVISLGLTFLMSAAQGRKDLVSSAIGEGMASQP